MLYVHTYLHRLAQFHSLPLMALASFPGSGNTWIRYLIEGATGVFTGSIYMDHGLAAQGRRGGERPASPAPHVLVVLHDTNEPRPARVI